MALRKKYYDTIDKGVDKQVALSLPADGANDAGQSIKGIEGVLESLHKAAQKTGSYTPKQLEQLTEYKNGIGNSYHSKLFPKGGTKSSTEENVVDGNDKVSKLTLLAEMRRKEIDLDNMKQLQGYQGVPRTVAKQQEPKDTYVAPLTKTSTSAPSLSNPTTVPFSMVPDKPALPNLKQTQTDAFGTPFKPFLETPKLGTDNNIPNSGFQLFNTPPPVKNTPDVGVSSTGRERVGITLQEQAQQHVPQILKKRQVSEEAMKQLDESAAQVRQQKLTPEQQVQFDKSYNDQRTKLQTDIDNTHKFDTDIAYYHFNNKVSSIAQNAYGTDKDGNVVIPNQNANKNQLDASFWSTLKTIVDHEKKSGKLQKDITEQDMLDGVLGSRYLIHDIMGDEYSDLRNRYSDFFDKYVQTKSDLGILDGQYKAKGGKEEQVPITNNVEQGKQGTGQPFMNGVVVPKDEVTWNSARRINQDLTQGASNVTFDVLGQAGAFVAGMFGDSYQHQQEVKGTIERGGSRAARFVSGVASIIPDHIKSQLEITDDGGEAARSDWQNIVGLFTVGETYRSPTASELHGTMRNMAATEQQQKLVEATDSPARDVVQAVSEIAMGIGFGDFNAAGKVSTGLGKTANFVKNAATLRKTADNLDDATVLANRVMNTLEKERKLGKNFDELVAGTNEGRKATLMARMMLPPSATASEAAHLATTLAIQHVAQHAENMSVGDIKEGVQTGTIFALMNVGLSKLFGGVAQRIASAQGTGKGLEASEIANKINSYKRIGTLFGQMATQPIQSKVAQAMNDGHWEKVFDPNEYMNRQAVIDIAMGGLGIKDLFKSVARTPAERERFNAMYEDAIDRISKGEATPEQIKQEVKNVVEEIRTEVPEAIVDLPKTGEPLQNEAVPVSLDDVVTETLKPRILGTTEMGTEIVEKPSAASFIESKFTELGIDPKTATARNLGTLLESFNDGSPFDAFLAKHAAGKGGDTPVQLKEVAYDERTGKQYKGVALKGKYIDGKYSVDADGNRTLEYAKNVAPERMPEVVREELMHNIVNSNIQKNENFRNEMFDILNQVASHPELDNLLTDALGGDVFTDVSEAVQQLKDYHLSTTNKGQSGGEYGYLKEFAVAGSNPALVQVMKQIPYTAPEGTKAKKGTIRTLWDKFIDVMSRMIPRLKGTTQEQHRTAFEAYYEALSKVPVEGETSTVTPEESGAMVNTLHQITGKKIQQEDLTEENMLLTRIIQEAVAREQYPNKFLGEVIDETKARQDESINSLIEETTLQNLERNAVVPEGRKYNELSGQEQIRAIANGIIERQSKKPSDVVADVNSIYEGTNDKLVAVADGDITAITGLSQEFQTAAEIIRTVKGLPNLKQADNYITELTKHGDPKIYLEGMALLRVDVEKTQPELLDSWDDAVRSIWRNRQNSQPIDNKRMELVVNEDEDGTKTYRFLTVPITETRTENGKVKKHRNVAAGLNRFKSELAKDKTEAGYAQSPTMQKALEEMTTKHLQQIHETKVIADGKYSFKSGYAVDDTAMAYQGELSMLKQDGTYMLKIGNKGGMLINMRDTVDYVMEDNGKFAVARLTELNDGNLWKALDSHELWNDGVTGSRFDKLSRAFSAVKIHHKVNVEKVPVDQLEFKDIYKLSIKDNGYQTKDGTIVSYDIAKANFDKNKEKLVPLFASIADKLNIMHKGVGTNERITPYAYRTKPEDPKDKLDAHYKELLTQINALYHWSVDPAGSQYFTDAVKGLPKIHEKYYGLLTGGSYVTFKRWADALVGMGYDDWSNKTDNDLEHIHAIHTIDDVKTIKFAVLDADIFENDEELKALLGKENTDGALFVFHKEHFKALQALSGNNQAGHVKTALATTKDGFSQMNKGDTHFIDIDYIKQIVAEVPELLPMYQRLITMADGLKRQGLFGVAMQTTMKGKGTYRLGMDGDVAFNNKRQAVGVKKLDGTIDLDKEKAIALNLEAQMNILNGGAVPNFAVLDMPLHGENAISFVNTSGANSRTQSPGISVNMMPRSVHGGGKYWKRVAKHINAYEDNLVKAANNLTSGYADAVAMLNAPSTETDTAPTYTTEQLRRTGTFLYELADYIKSKEASEFSGVASSREMSEKIELCITKDGLARPELVPGLLVFRELFYKQEYKGTKDEGKDTSREDLRPLALQMLGQRVKDLYDGKGLGATATAMPDITARADYFNLLKELNITDEFVGTGIKDKMWDEKTGAYAKGSNGATISRDIFNKLNKQLRRRGLPMLDIGSKVFLKVTPADDVSSFAPFVLMGLTETPNTIMANREYVLQVTGKDFDGDTMGIFVDSLEWHDEDGTNHFDLLHNETTALGMHKGSEKKADNQSTVMEAAVKYRDGISEALRHVVIGDGTNPRSIKVPINPMHPDHAEYLLNTTRDIGTVIDKIHEISQAFQNTIRKFTPDRMGGYVMEYKGLTLLYNAKLMGNYSLVKQLGAVDMYMPQGINIEDLLYGTVIQKYNGKNWSSLTDKERAEAVEKFERWTGTASGIVIKDIMKGKDGTVSGVSKKTGEDFKIDKVEQHFKEVGRDGESISSKMLVGLRAKMQAQVNPIVLYDMVNQGTNDLQDENKPLVEKIKPILDKFAYAMRHVISKFSVDGQVNDNNYIKAMTVENYAYSNPVDKTPQNSETKITMGTNLFYAIQTSTWVPIPNKEIFKGKNGIVSISSDNSGLFFKVRTIKGVQEYYLKDVVKRNGTIDPTFASELEAIGTSEALLFRDEVKASLSVSPLSTSEAGYLVGAILANVGHYYERVTGGVSNADIFAGTALVSVLPTMISKNKGSTGTFLNHKQYNENITSDPMTVISGAKAYGVVPLVGMPGEKLSDKVQYMVGSQSRYLGDEGSSGAVTIKQPVLSKIGQWMKDTFKGEVDIRNPQHIQRAVDELPAIIKEQYGELVTPERLDEVLAALHHTLYQDHKTASERDMTADESNKRFLTAMSQLDRSLRNSRQAIKAAGGIRAWVQGIKDFFHFDEVTPTEANTATNVAHRLGEDRMTAVASQPLGVALEFQADGSISTTEKVLSDKLDMELLTYQQVLDGTKGVFNYVEPHRTASSDIDGFVNRLDNDMGAIKKVLTKGTEYSPADYAALVDALESSEVPELNLRITATGTGGAYDVTAFITVNGIEHSFKLSDTNLRGTFNTALKDLQLGHVTGAVRSKVRFSKNYDSDTPDIEKRRAFLTEATSGKTQWNAESQQNEYVQGAAYSKARDNAMEVGDKLYLHDIETKVWYEEDPGKGTLVQIDKPPVEVMNNNYLHITSKLENHPTLTQEVHHNYIDELMDMYMITPTSRTKEESIDTQVQKIASEGREDDIKRAISGMIMAKMVQTKLTMSQVEFMANIDWIMNRDKDIAPQHLKDYVAKVGKDMTDEIARRTTTADFTDIVRDMSTIEGLDQISNVLEVLDTFVEVNAEDDAAWQNITAALYKHEDYLTPIPRYQLSKQIKNVKGTFNREIAKLEKAMGKNGERDYYKKEPISLSKDQENFGIIDILKVLREDKYVSIGIESLLDKYSKSGDFMHQILDYVTTTLYLQSPDPNDIAHRNILHLMNTSGKRGVLRTVNEDMNEWKKDAHRMGVTSDLFHNIDPGTIFDIQLLDNVGEPLLLKDQSYLGTVMRDVVDTKGNKLGNKPFIMALDRSHTQVTWIDLDNVQQMNSAIANDKDMKVQARTLARNTELQTAVMKLVKGKPLVKHTRKGEIDSIEENGTAIQQFGDIEYVQPLETNTFKQRKGLLDTYQVADAESQTLFSRYRTFGESMQVAATYLHQNAALGFAAAALYSIGKGTFAAATGDLTLAGQYMGAVLKASGKLVSKLGMPILQNYIGTSSLTTRTTEKTYFGGLINDIWNSNTGLQSASRMFSKRPFDTQQSEMTANIVSRRIKAGAVGSFTEQVKASGMDYVKKHEGFKGTALARMFSDPRMVSKFEQIEKDVTASLPAAAKMQEGIRKLATTATAELMKDLESVNATIRIVDGNAKVFIDGKTIDQFRSDMVSFVAGMTAITAGTLLQKSEVHSAGITGTVNENNVHDFVPEYDYLRPHQQVELLNAFSDFTLGKYERPVAQLSGFARGLTLFSHYGAPKVHYQQQGLVLRDNLFQATKNATGTQNIGTFNSGGMIVKNPRKQIRAWLINGLIVRTIGAGIIAGTSSFVAPNLLNDMVQAHPVSAVLYAGWNVAIDAMKYDEKNDVGKVRIEGNIKTNLDGVAGSMGMGMGQKSMTGVMTYGLQLAKDLVDDGEITNLEQDSELNQAWTVTKNLMNTFPVTAPLSSAVSAAEEVRKIQKDVEE